MGVFELCAGCGAGKNPEPSPKALEEWARAQGMPLLEKLAKNLKLVAPTHGDASDGDKKELRRCKKHFHQNPLAGKEGKGVRRKEELPTLMVTVSP